MKTKMIIGIFLALGLLSFFQGCKKYLDAKPDKSLSTPSTVSDLQGFLDNISNMNENCAETGEISADAYYLTDAVYPTLFNQDGMDLYLWKIPFYQDDWQGEYNVVYNANLVLDNIGNINRDASNAETWDNCKGSALLYRGKAFFEIAQIWAKAYDSSTASNDLGIPLRLTSDFNTPSKRANVQDTYNQIISDLKASIPLLPVNPVNIFRPSKAAAYGLLARTFLSMRNYASAKIYADSCLALKNTLLDFNTLDPTQVYPFSNIEFTNPEDIMHSACAVLYGDLLYGYASVDSTLFASYANNDLRKTIYFVDNGAGGQTFQGSYDVFANYNGLATDEVYLIRAECEARSGDTNDALADLNLLLKNRYKTGAFTAVNITDATALKNYILNERRKELYFRMLRWGDIKRLNLEGANISVTRVIGGKTYTLEPNDHRFALPIPSTVIQLSGIQQNP